MFKLLLILKLISYYLLAFFWPLFVSKKKKPKSILFLSCFFPGNSGYNWRAKEWAILLEKEGYQVDVFHAIEKEEFYKYKDSNLALFLILFLKRRFWQVLKSAQYEKVVVRRELLLFNDYGNLFLDKLLLKIHPNAILDFDDDIAFAKKEPRKIESLFGKILLENGSKFTQSIGLYNKFIVGSQYLKEYVLARNQNLPKEHIVVLPTCVNYEKYKPKAYHQEKKLISLGWIGGNHNLFLLDTIIEDLNQISQKYHIELVVIAGKEYANQKAAFPIINKRWSLETEKENLKTIDIGLMPLNHTDRDKGKCSFKLIQYMGMGIVSVATNVGMNKEVIHEQKNEGFLALDNWVQPLEKAIKQKANWTEIGRNSRIKVLNFYSYKANLPKLVSFLKTIS